MFILRNFKSNDFVTAYSKGFADAFLVCAHSKGVASADVRASRSGSLSVRFAFCSLVLLAFSCLALIVLTAGRQARAKNPLDIFPRRGYLAGIPVVGRGGCLL